MMSPRARKRFYVGFALACVLLFCGGILAGYLSRNNAICSDRKPPAAQLDQGFGYVQYKCHNGEVVTK